MVRIPQALRSPEFRQVAFGLLFGTAGGIVFAAAGLPLPWMLGPMVLTMLASLAGLRFAVPQRLRRPMIAVVGVLLGSTFTLDRLAAAIPWLPSLAALPVYVVTVGALIYLYLLRFGGFDRRSAFFAATPGGLSEMIALSDSFGADPRTVALIHGTRLSLIVLVIPLLADAIWTIDRSSTAAASSLALDEALILALAGGLGYGLGVRLRLPAGAFVGPLIASALVHLAGWVEAAPPATLVAAAQVVIGTSVGARFVGVPLAAIRHAMLLGAGATLIMLAVTLVFAVALMWFTGHPLILLLLAYIPGGFTEMSLIAYGLGVDPAFVVSHHGLRVFLVVSIALPVYSWLDRRGWFDQGAGTAKARE